MAERNLERRCYHFYGSVQGVGFRYRARYAAELYGLTGWVENLDDGSVVLEAQGPAEELNKLVHAILNQSRWIVVEHVDVTTLPLRAGERGFSTRGW